MAKEACEAGAVQVNRRPAKASTEVKPGDIITLTLGSRWVIVEVLATPEHVPAEKARELYRIVEEGRTTSNFQA